MENETKELIKLTTREILLSFCDGIAKIEEIFGYNWQRKEAKAYQRWRETDKNSYYQKLWKLEKQGYIKRYKKEKKTIIKLTKIGTNQAIKYLLDDFKISKPKAWDKKWHLVIFDIPNDKKNLRDVLRLKLKKLGFLQLQKSVFVYPFECKKVIFSLKYIYSLSSYIQYIIADSIESEIDLVDYFYNQRIISIKNTK